MKFSLNLLLYYLHYFDFLFGKFCKDFENRIEFDSPPILLSKICFNLLQSMETFVIDELREDGLSDGFFIVSFALNLFYFGSKTISMEQFEMRFEQSFELFSKVINFNQTRRRRRRRKINRSRQQHRRWQYS